MGGVAYWWLREVLPGSSPRARLECPQALGLDRVLLGPPFLAGVEWPEVVAELLSGPLKALAVDLWPSSLREADSASRLTDPGILPALGAAVRLAVQARAPLVLVRPGLLPMGPGWQGDPRGIVADPPAAARASAALREQVGNRLLEQICRRLYQACQDAPGVRFCLCNGADLAGLDRPEELEAIRDDLGRERVGFWLDVQAAALRGAAGEVPLGAWLDRLGSGLAGVTLGDALPGQPGLPPGTGLVDFRLLAECIKLPGRTLPWILELDPRAGLAGLGPAVEELRRWGLA